MTILKGKCTNFGNCNHADHAQIFDIPLTGNTPVCPECGKEAIPITRKKIKPGHIAIIGGIVMLLVLVVKVLMVVIPMMFKPSITIEVKPPDISVSKPEVKPEPPKPESAKPESKPTVKPEQIIGFLEQGDFAQVREMIRKLPATDNLIRKLRTPIKLTVKFQYRKKGQKPSEIYPIESPQVQGITLTHEDNYRLEIEVPSLPEPLYLYVFRKDHYGKIYRRFPDPETYSSMNLPDLKNPIQPGRTYSIPPGQNKYIYLDELSSDEKRSIPETVYVIASPFDAKDVNAFFGKIHQETDADTRNKLMAEFIQRVRSRETSGFASLFFREFVFYHAR